MENVKVVLWGLGVMGSGMAKMLLDKQGVTIVGAIKKRAEGCGRDLSEVLGVDAKTGVIVSNDVEKVLSEAKGDILVHATGSFVTEVEPEILLAVKHGYNVVTIAEEMAYPWIAAAPACERMDAAAKAAGVSIFGTGINPGFVLDFLIASLSSVCRRVDSIEARRVNDLAAFGHTVMATQGVGTTVEEFHAGIASGKIVGHIGFQQSISLIAKALGWKLDRIEETREPIITNVHREAPFATVEPGMVAGCNHTGIGYMDGKAVITLRHPQQIRPELEGIATGDYVDIKGDPNVSFGGSPEIPGGIGTIATAVNYIPNVINGRSGLLDLTDLPLPAARMGDFRDYIVK